MEQSQPMMKGTVTTIQSKAYGFPRILRDIPDPPQQLYVTSQNWETLLAQPAVAVVGSRKVSAYGRAVTIRLVTELARAGVCIISGLAIGVDALAHRTALEAGGTTIAVLAGGLGAIYPRLHQGLAQAIVDSGGALVSEYSAEVAPLKHHFVARNRLVSGLSQAVLITEAAERSGTLHTAAFALDQGREVCAVPGEITSPTSKGTNRLIQNGALLVASAHDILDCLGIAASGRTAVIHGDTPEQEVILKLLAQGITDSAALLQRSRLGVVSYNQSLTLLELTGKITALGNNQWTLHQAR